MNWPSGNNEVFFKVCQCIFNISLSFPLGKGMALHFEKLKSPSTKDACAKFGWNWPSGSGEEDENVKSLHQDRGSDGRRDRQTDDGQQAIKKAHLNFHLRWATKKHIQIKQKFWNVHCISLFDAILRSNQEWFSSHKENRNTSSWIMEWLLYMLTTCHCVGWPKRTCKDLKSIQSSANCMYVWANWF